MATINQSITEENKFANKWAILIAIMLGSLLTPLDSSIVNTVLPTITEYFNTDISVVQWVPTVYLLTLGCIIMLYGRLGDMVGHKKIFVTGLAAFTASSILCGLSQSIWMLIVCRVLQGLAAGMTMSVGFALVVAAFPATERGKALGFYATGVSIAMALGPTLGGIIAEHLGWRYIFFINVPIGVTSFIWCSRVIPRSATKPGQRLDIPGTLAFFVFLPTLLLYCNRGEEWGWASPLSLTMLSLAVVFGLIFLRIERNSKHPMLQLRIFVNRVFTLSTISYCLYIMSIIVIIFITPFFLKFVWGYTIFKVGLMMAALPIIQLLTAPFSGTLSDRFGSRVFAVSGMCIMALGLFFLANLKESASEFDVIWRLVVAGFGGAVFASPNNSTIMGSVSQQYLGITSGLMATTRNVSMVFGIAIAGAILYGLAPATSSASPGSFTPAEMDEFINGLHWVYLAGAFAAVASAVISILAIQRRKQNPD